MMKNFQGMNFELATLGGSKSSEFNGLSIENGLKA
jgi:hypothetical protein